MRTPRWHSRGMRLAWVPQILQASSWLCCCGGQRSSLGSGEQDPTVVQIDSGTLLGELVPPTTFDLSPRPLAVRQYLGIPFARAERFAAPRRNEPWRGLRRATELGPMCWQPSKDEGQSSIGVANDSCLVLNVYSPVGAEDAPVMFFIHGGGGVYGSGDLYNGSVLASYEGVVIVTMNYRLGPYGVWTSSGTSPTGNWGIMDQQMAMQWVQSNIAAFGGDRKRVTIFGQSSGACFVVAHLVAPGSRGFFHGAIVQSGTASWGFPERAAAALYYDEVARLAGCRDSVDLDCLRAAEPGILMPSQEGWAHTTGQLGFNAVDGHTMPGKPLELIAAGKFHNVPVIMGANADDALGGPSLARPLSAFRDQLLRWTANASALAPGEALYEDGAYRRGRSRLQATWKRLQHMERDSNYACESTYLADAIGRAGGRVWVYFFEMASIFAPSLRRTDLASVDTEFAGVSLGDIGCFHSAEIDFIFRGWNRFPWRLSNVTAGSDIDFSMPHDALLGTPALREGAGAHVRLANVFSGLWASMARSGHPGDAWPAFNASSRRYLLVEDAGARVTTQRLQRPAAGLPGGLPAKEICDFWRHQKGLGRYWNTETSPEFVV